MEKILITKTTSSGHISLIQNGKWLRTVLYDLKHDFVIEKNHRTMDGACKRLSQWIHNARPFTKEKASDQIWRRYGWPNAYFDKLEQQA